VAKFAKEFLVTKKYYSQNLSFWVNSKLMPDQATQDKTFATTHITVSNSDSFSSQEAVQNLFESYTCFIFSFNAASTFTSYNDTKTVKWAN